MNDDSVSVAAAMAPRRPGPDHRSITENEGSEPMYPTERLIVAHSIMDDRIREARREHLLHQHDGPGRLVRIVEAVKGVSVVFRGFGGHGTPAGAHSR